ncbi:SulP family inorganic anion transporter [Calycomorphotria hydatis]
MSEREWEAVTQSVRKRYAETVKSYADAQNQITADLEKLAEEIRHHEADSSQEKHEAIEEYTQTALTLSQQADKLVEEGNVLETSKMLFLAAEGILDLEKGLKNHNFAAELGLIAIVIIILWEGFAPKQVSFLPGPLLAIVAVTLIAYFMSLPVLYVEIPDNLLANLHFVNPNTLTDLPWGVVLQGGLVLAIVASAETLLCAVAVDAMGTGVKTKYDRELAAQGAGNMVCGLLGALPMTGVIVRSSANVQAGGKTRWSAFLHGVWLLVFVAVLTPLLRNVPTSALAAILVYIGYKLINVKGFRELWKIDKGEAAIFLATVILIVAEDLLVGVVVGVILSAIKLLYTFSHLTIEVEEGSQPKQVNMLLRGAATFIRLPMLATKLEELPDDAELHVDMHELTYIDHACLELLVTWAKRHESQGGKLVMDWESMHAKFRDDRPLTSNRGVPTRPKNAILPVQDGTSDEQLAGSNTNT